MTECHQYSLAILAAPSERALALETRYTQHKPSFFPLQLKTEPVLYRTTALNVGNTPAFSLPSEVPLACAVTDWKNRTRFTARLIGELHQ